MRQDLRAVLDRLREGAYVVDRQRRITYWNDAAERITGFAGGAVAGRSCADNILIHVDETGRNLCTAGCPLLTTLTTGAPHEADLFLHHQSGHRVPVAIRVAPLHDETGEVTGAVELFSAVTSEGDLAARMDELERLARLDELTRIPNRRHLLSELSTRLRQQRASAVPVGVLFIDVDRFKRLNDRYGHAVGDRALQTVARTLQAAVRPFDTIGRWGGEEFVGVFPNVTAGTLTAIATRLGMLVRTSRVESTEGPIAISVSVGGTLARAGETAREVLGRADAAMYASKQAGRDRVTIETMAPTGALR